MKPMTSKPLPSQYSKQMRTPSAENFACMPWFMATLGTSTTMTCFLRGFGFCQAWAFLPPRPPPWSSFTSIIPLRFPLVGTSRSSSSSSPSSSPLAFSSSSSSCTSSSWLPFPSSSPSSSSSFKPPLPADVLPGLFQRISSPSMSSSSSSRTASGQTNGPLSCVVFSPAGAVAFAELGTRGCVSVRGPSRPSVSPARVPSLPLCFSNSFSTSLCETLASSRRGCGSWGLGGIAMPPTCTMPPPLCLAGVWSMMGSLPMLPGTSSFLAERLASM
mmetsp:Transcript_4014/g.14180  ORF Transcript_4014/g.14180 Transcript_4014/m.14180 type:complete len:273 (+) Transcript_4014:399-1217(+)